MRLEVLSDDAAAVLLTVASSKGGGWRWLVAALETEDRRRELGGTPAAIAAPLARWTLLERHAVALECHRLHQGGRLLADRDEDGAGELYAEISAFWLALALEIAPPDQRRRIEEFEASMEAALEEAEEAGRRAAEEAPLN